jgi:hypothetical protein
VAPQASLWRERTGARLPQFSADYVRGRRMKTDVVLRPDGSGTLTTSGRGKAAILWLDRLKGKKTLRVVPP